MSLEIGLGTPLAEALNAAILPKLLEVGWGTGGSDDSALAEYIILMLVNGKTQDEIAAELSGDLLNLPLDDPVVHEFSKWLFEQVHVLSAPNGQQNGGDSMGDAAVGEMDTDMGSHDVSELNAPTGPRSMRNGNFRGGRDKRMFGQMSKAMDRSNDNVLHRVRGQTGGGRIDTHARAPPTGPRGGRGGMMRNHNNNNNNRGMVGGVMPGAPGGPGFPQWQMQGQPNQLDVMAILEQQSQMMLELSQQMMNNGNGSRGFGQQRRGKSLFERTQDPRHKNNFRRGQGSNQADSNGDEVNMETAAEGEDADMGKREPPNPDDTICKYNLRCTNKDCNFAHQSPAAPPGVSIDVNDVCGFGAACKNRKCVGRHPSPAARLAHQSEQDCKFFPNCQNARCPFKHPSMPLCRNGADCTTANCKFTHVKTKCKFNPCLNPTCAFAHEEGQQGGFKDKVWTPEQGHVSERKFVDDEADEDFIHPFAPGTPTLEDMVQNEVIG